MELIESLELNDFISIPVLLTIQGKEEEDKPAWMEKVVQSVELCPDGTHVRLYFDSLHFIAFPKDSVVSRKENTWSAFDQETFLTYLMEKKGEDSHD